MCFKGGKGDWQAGRRKRNSRQKKKKTGIKVRPVVAGEAEPHADLMHGTGYVSHKSSLSPHPLQKTGPQGFPSPGSWEPANYEAHRAGTWNPAGLADRCKSKSKAQNPHEASVKAFWKLKGILCNNHCAERSHILRLTTSKPRVSEHHQQIKQWLHSFLKRLKEWDAVPVFLDMPDNHTRARKKASPTLNREERSLQETKGHGGMYASPCLSGGPHFITCSLCLRWPSCGGWCWRHNTFLSHYNRA